MTSGPELGGWLRQQREARSWARSEMARRLIRVAHANCDTSVPSADSLTRNICRWERGIVGLTERYRLYYCQAFGISPADFGTAQAASVTYRLSLSAEDVAGLLADLRAAFREWRECSSRGGGKGAQSVPRSRNDCLLNLPNPDDAVRIAAFVGDRIEWSAFWDKRYGVWRVSEDDPDSGLYAESTDARQVLDYMAAHS